MITSEMIGKDGKVALHPKAGGEPIRRWPVDAKEILASGEYVLPAEEVKRDTATVVAAGEDGQGTAPAEAAPTPAQVAEDGVFSRAQQEVFEVPDSAPKRE